MSAKPATVSLKYFLIIPFAILIFMAVLITGWLGMKYSQQLMLNASSQISAQANDKLQQSIMNYLDHASKMNALVTRPLHDGLLSIDNISQLQRYINRVVKEDFGEVHTLQLGTIDDQYYGAGWSVAQDLLEKTASQDTNYHFVTRLVNENTMLAEPKILSSKANYQVNQRPWYQAAINSSTPVWSPVYEMFSHGKLGMTLSETVYDDKRKLIGVVGTDILLDELSAQLQQTFISDNTILLILDKKNQLLAMNQALSSPQSSSSKQQNHKNTTSNRLSLQSPETADTPKNKGITTLMTVTEYASKHDIELLHSLMQMLDSADLRQLAFSETRKLPSHIHEVGADEKPKLVPYSVRYTPLTHQGLDLQLISITPQSDLLNNLNNIKYITLVALLVGVFLTLLLAALLAYLVKRSTSRLVSQINAIQDDGSGFTPNQYLSTEFNMIDKAFAGMMSRFKDRFNALKQDNHVLASTVMERTRQLTDANAQLMQLTYTDKITGLANRRKFDEFLAENWHQILDIEKQSIAMLVCDIDHFKQYNDTYGHQAGDACMRKIAQTLSDCVGKDTLVARYGGEEFTIAMLCATRDDAVTLAKTVLAEVKKLKIEHILSPTSAHITVSIGIAAATDSEIGSSDALIDQAHTARYFAKNAGRNTYHVATNASPILPQASE